MPKRSKAPGLRAVLIVMVLSAMGVGVLASYVANSPSARRVPDALRTPEAKPTPGPKTNIEVHATPQPTTEAKLFVSTYQDGKLRLVEASLPTGDENKVAYAVTESLKNLGVDKAHALGVQMDGSNATIDMSPELYQGFGSMEEGQVVEALQLVLGQFKEINTFQLRVDGQIVDSLGHLELSEPIAVSREGAPTEPAPTTPSANP